MLMKAKQVIATINNKAARDDAERREVTVLFSDLVGLIKLTDANDRRELISAYRKCVADTMCRYDGGMLEFLCDGALIYFGYPQTHEDDAERAVLAAIHLIGEVAQLKEHVSVRSRAGIATGPLATEDLIRSEKAQGTVLVGEAPTVAMRIVKGTEQGDLVIADNTRKHLGYLFEFDDLDPRDSKGTALRRIEEIAEVPPDRRIVFRIAIADLIFDFAREHKKLLDPEWRKKVKDLTTEWTKSLVQVLKARSLMERATLELKSAIAKFDEAHGQAIRSAEVAPLQIDKLLDDVLDWMRSPPPIASIMSAERSGPGRPPWQAQSLFHAFLCSFLVTVNSDGGALTYDKNYPERSTLLRALALLRPIMPPGFIPVSPSIRELLRAWKIAKGGAEALENMISRSPNARWNEILGKILDREPAAGSPGQQKLVSNREELVVTFVSG
jgi:class 3 adenylate cyclase